MRIALIALAAFALHAAPALAHPDELARRLHDYAEGR